MPNKIKSAALMYEIAVIGDGVSNEIHLIPYGEFRANDGRPHDCESWLLNAAIAAQVLERFKATQKPMLIDYDHLSLNDERENPVFAAGWVNQMEYRETAGIYAVNVDWTPKAKQQILDKEMRYISPVFFYLENTGEVLDIVSVALTNTPGLDCLDEVQIAALTRKLTHGDSMSPDKNSETEKIVALTVERDTLKNQLAALTSERDTAKTQVAALTTERDVLKTKVATLEQEKVTAAAENEKQQCADLLKAALTSGKIIPAMKPYLEKKTTVADLTEAIDAFGGNGVAAALLTKQHTKDSEPGGHGLSDVELAACKRMGVTPENYLKAKGGE